MPEISTFTKQEISKLFRTARRCVRHASLDILLAPSLIDGPGRLLVITPRRVANAPNRNKIRRQFKALFYEGNFAQYKLDCVIIIKPQAIGQSFDDHKALLCAAFKQALTLFPDR